MNGSALSARHTPMATRYSTVTKEKAPNSSAPTEDATTTVSRKLVPLEVAWSIRPQVPWLTASRRRLRRRRAGEPPTTAASTWRRPGRSLAGGDRRRAGGRPGP